MTRSNHRRQVTPEERREAFEAIYAAIPREELQRAAQQRLDSDLRLAAPRWGARMRMVAYAVIAALLFTAVLAVFYTLELTRSSAQAMGESLEDQRAKALDTPDGR